MGTDVPVIRIVFLNVDLKKIWIDAQASGNMRRINGVDLGRLEGNQPAGVRRLALAWLKFRRPLYSSAMAWPAA